MRFWVAKGSPAVNNWKAILRPERTGSWYTARIPKELQTGDRLILWESSPGLRIVGLGEVLEADAGTDEEGNRLFGVRYLTRELQRMPTIAELRNDPHVRDASFLKPGPATVLNRLTTEQAVAILSMMADRDPSIRRLWSDLPNSAKEPPPEIELQDLIATEGAERWVTHLTRERDRRIVAEKKKSVIRKQGKLQCEGCDLDFIAVYGAAGEAACDVHHKLPLSHEPGERETSLDDLVILCATCHRVIHRMPDPANVGALKRGIRRR